MSAAIRRSLPSRLAAIDGACTELRARLAAAGLASASFGVELVARELLVNAVVHGNQSSPARRVRLQFTVGRRWLRLWIADAGPGYAWRALARRAIPGEQQDCGRGLAIANRYADRVTHNRRGNEVTALFRRPATKMGRKHG